MHPNAPKRKHFVKEYSLILLHNTIAPYRASNIDLDIRKSLTINDLRKPGPRNPLIVNDLGQFPLSSLYESKAMAT